MLIRLYRKVEMWWVELNTRDRGERGAAAADIGLLVMLGVAAIFIAIEFLGHQRSSPFVDLNANYP